MSHALINGLTGYLEHPTKQWTAEIIDNYPEHDSQGRISCTFYPESLRLENDDYDDDDDKNNENNENNENNDSDRPAARRCLCHANMHSP